MAESERRKISGRETRLIVLQLRTWAETIRTKRKDRYELLVSSADRLDELEERVAIMTEPSVASEEQLSFPPNDDELR